MRVTPGSSEVLLYLEGLWVLLAPCAEELGVGSGSGFLGLLLSPHLLVQLTFHSPHPVTCVSVLFFCARDGFSEIAEAECLPSAIFNQNPETSWSKKGITVGKTLEATTPV